jgi:hypothetical protein
MALDFVIAQDRPSILVLDAFFSLASVFLIANAVWSVKLKALYLTLIVRAKKNYVAYFEPEPPKPGQLGRPKVYGSKLKLMECFVLHPPICNRFLPHLWPARTGLDAHPKPDLETQRRFDPIRLRLDPSRSHRVNV